MSQLAPSEIIWFNPLILLIRKEGGRTGKPPAQNLNSSFWQTDEKTKKKQLGFDHTVSWETIDLKNNFAKATWNLYDNWLKFLFLPSVKFFPVC